MKTWLAAIFIRSILVTVLCAVGLVFLFSIFTGCSDTVQAQTPELISCTVVLADANTMQLAQGDVELATRDLPRGGAEINYVNKKTGVYTQYLLFAVNRSVIIDLGVSVFSSCYIPIGNGNAVAATVYRLQWLNSPTAPKERI